MMVLIVRFDDFLCETNLEMVSFILKFYCLWKKYRNKPFAHSPVQSCWTLRSLSVTLRLNLFDQSRK